MVAENVLCVMGEALQVVFIQVAIWIVHAAMVFALCVMGKELKLELNTNILFHKAITNLGGKVVAYRRTQIWKAVYEHYLHSTEKLGDLLYNSLCVINVMIMVFRDRINELNIDTDN